MNSADLDTKDPEVTKSADFLFPNKYFNVFLITSNPDAKKIVVGMSQVMLIRTIECPTFQ